MSLLQKRCQIQGMGTTKLLDLIKQRGIPLYDIQQKNINSLTCSCPARYFANLTQLAESAGFSLTELPAAGVLLILHKLRKRFPLFVFSFFALIMLFFSLQFIWNIQISGGGIYQGEIELFHHENRIYPGMLKKKIDVQKICDGLLNRLPKIAWVRARVSGITLYIEVTEGIQQPRTRSIEGNGDIIASCDGIITAIQVYNGIAAVKPGDLVHAGEVLIRGEERAGINTEKKNVPAAGMILARIWRSAQAVLPTKEYISNPTGKIETVQRFTTPWFTISLENEPSYLTADKEIELIPIGTTWWPLWLERIIYSEVSVEEKARNREEVQTEAGILAMQNLLVSCDKNDEIIDKWLNYSMIERDAIQAIATAEIITDIGRYIPNTTE